MKLSLFSLSVLTCINLYGSPWIDGCSIPARTLEYRSEWIDAPGEKRFYHLVNMQEGTGLLSGSNQEGLHWVVVQWTRVLDSANPLPEAKERAIWYSRVSAEKVQDIALVTKTVRRLCDILLPAELRQKVLYESPSCKHENEEACKRYSADIIVKIKALAQAAPTSHQALIMVPEYRYHY
jgi:hypothetical protein